MNLLSCCCLLSLFLSLASATNQLFGDPPQLMTPQHPNVYVYEQDGNGVRQNLVLPCPLVNTVNVSYEWFRGDQAVSAEMVDENGNLTVVNITEGEYASQEGVEYYCVASRTIGRNPFTAAVRSRTIKVFYATFGGFRQTTAVEVPVSVALTSNVALECDVVSANPPPQYRWYRDGVEIDEIRPSNALRFLEGGRYLFIARVSAADLSSTFRCEVTNAFVFQSVMAPTTYRLVDNLTRGVPMEYKQIGDLTAFLGNQSFEFSYVVGIFGSVNSNLTSHFPTIGDITINNVNGIASISTISSVGTFVLKDIVTFFGDDGVTGTGNLVVHQLPVITRSPMNNTDLIVGGRTEPYICEFEGTPSPSIEWFFNGRPISPDSGVSISENSLTVASPRVDNSGIYQCIVSNDFGDDQASWLLEIRQSIQPVVMESNSTEMTASEDRDLGALIVQDNGTTVNFFVILMADPCPNITWFFNSTPLGPSNSTFMFNDPCTEANTRSPEWNFTLSVSPLTQETSGSYTASLTNQAGTTELPTPAYFTIPAPVSVTGLTLSLPCLKEGQNITLRCIVSGFPRPNVQFSVNGTTITPGRGVYANFIEQTFFDEVIILNVNSNTRGLYSCSANGSRGTPRTYDFCTIPTITELTATSNPVIGSSFFIQCTVSGTPRPTISWKLNEIPLTASDDEVLRIVSTNNGQTSRVEVSASRRGFDGVYQCIASNDAGNDTMNLRIELQENNQLPLSLGAIIGIAAGGVGLIVLIALVILLLVCFYAIGKKTSTGKYSANPAHMGDYNDGRGNVDKDSDEEDGQPEAFNPQYESLPALRPSRPPSYKPTPSYPMGEDMEMKKVPLDSDSYLGPPGGYMMQDNGMAFSRPGVDDFLSEDAQFV